MNTQISKGRVFHKKFIQISIKKEKQQNNKYHILDKDNLNKNKRINNNNIIVSGIIQDMQLKKIKDTNSKIVEKLQNI